MNLVSAEYEVSATWVYIYWLRLKSVQSSKAVATNTSFPAVSLTLSVHLCAVS